MLLVRFRVPGQGDRLGLVNGDRVLDLTALGPSRFASFATLLADSEASGRPMAALVDEALAAAPAQVPGYEYAALDRVPGAEPYLLDPVGAEEVWASGVTYLRSREARVSETNVPDIYQRVYEAPRPELFLKSTRARTVGSNDYVCIRGDADWHVPEPELGLVLDSRGQIVGYTIGNDMSSRDIEGENPLYLPQAKIFHRSCSIGPAVLVAKEEANPAFQIALRIRRKGAVVVEGEVSTRQMKRTFTELAGYLRRDNDLFPPTVLLTGTGLVPDNSFTLEDGDLVEIAIEGIGTLRNRVKRLPGA